MSQVFKVRAVTSKPAFDGDRELLGLSLARINHTNHRTDGTNQRLEGVVQKSKRRVRDYVIRGS